MKNPFKNSSRDAITRQSENPKKEIRVLYKDPIFFGEVPKPAEESTKPADDNNALVRILIGGSLVAMMCLWWFAPDWLLAAWQKLVTQIFQFAEQ